jgi:hypothetical protein
MKMLKIRSRGHIFRHLLELSKLPFAISSNQCCGPDGLFFRDFSSLLGANCVVLIEIKANACAIILSHNHPSGNMNPSQSDMDLTKKMKEAGKFLEVSVLDHIIITSEGYYSFADEGLLEPWSLFMIFKIHSLIPLF